MSSTMAAAGVTDEQLRVFAARSFVWYYDGQHFRHEVTDVATLFVGCTLSHKWVPRYRDYRLEDDRKDWQGPAFDDPVTALVHAETCNWGQT